MHKFLMAFLSAGMIFWSSSALCDSKLLEEKTITLKKPPEALAKWYKPANKRQVWLHTMFRLRREMLAMNDYSKQKMQPELEKWSQKFIKDYQSISEMVPQWQDYLYLDKLNELEQHVKDHNYSAIPTIVKKLSKSCMHCHDDFQTVSTLLYRTADFDQQMVRQADSEQLLAYDEVMLHLSDSVNRINIAIKDGYFNNASQAIEPLQRQLNELANGCANCHNKELLPVERIMGPSRHLLQELTEQLKLKDKKQSGRKLGEFAVKVCARCHATHRMTADLKSQLK